MPGMAPSVRTERDALLAYLVQQREGLKHAAFGLDEEQIRLPPTRSLLCLGGLLKHAAAMERTWSATMLGRADQSGEQAYADTFSLAEADTLEELVADLDRAAAETAAVVNDIEDFGVTVQLPQAPWLPRDPEGFAVRWILLHLIEELARHAGHADILREHVDGATTYELMAAAEGWPETDWIKPWKPSGPTGSV